MAISVGDAVVKLGLDKTGFDRDMASVKDRLVKHSRAIGMALTGVGVAGLAIIESTKKMNAQLGVTALNLGITTKEMRNMALETTNVTFPIKEVIGTFDLLARAGVKDQQILKDVATAFDTLGDAIDMPASLVTEKLIPTMKTFGLTATEMAEKTDALTYLFRNTTVSLDDFDRMVGYVTPDLVAMGLTTEDMIAILADLEAQGYSGEVMTREFRKAVTLATQEQIPLNEALGISTEKIESYKGELAGATGITQEYADVANEQYTIMDKLKQSWSEITLRLGSFLEPLEPILAGMTALGPLMMALSTSIGQATIKWAAHTVALIAHKVAMLASAIAIKAVTAAQWLWNVAMTANPIGLLIVAIAALIAIGVLLWKNWDTVSAKMKIAFGAIVHAAGWMWDKILWYVGGIVEGFAWLLAQIATFVNIFSHKHAVAIVDAANTMSEAFQKFRTQSVDSLTQFGINFQKTVEVVEKGAADMQQSIGEAFEFMLISMEAATAAGKSWTMQVTASEHAATLLQMFLQNNFNPTLEDLAGFEDYAAEGMASFKEHTEDSIPTIELATDRLHAMGGKYADLATRIERLIGLYKKATAAVREFTEIAPKPYEPREPIGGREHGGVIPSTGLYLLHKREIVIPALEAGIITRRTLVSLGEAGVKKVVIPLDRSERMLRGGAYRTANIYIMLDERVLAEVLEQRLVDDMRLRTGSRI